MRFAPCTVLIGHLLVEEVNAAEGGNTKHTNSPQRPHPRTTNLVHANSLTSLPSEFPRAWGLNWPASLAATGSNRQSNVQVCRETFVCPSFLQRSVNCTKFSRRGRSVARKRWHVCKSALRVLMSIEKAICAAILIGSKLGTAAKKLWSAELTGSMPGPQQSH